MTLLLRPSSFSSAAASPSSSSTSRPALSLHIASSLSLGLQRNLVLQPTLYDGAKVSTSFARSERRLTIACASSETDGRDGIEPDNALPEESDEDVPVQNLPLESKLQLKLEQKLRMKVAKKIRLRRKKLLRKRRMRKKGRWPPSKMKKLKNV